MNSGVKAGVSRGNSVCLLVPFSQVKSAKANGSFAFSSAGAGAVGGRGLRGLAVCASAYEEWASAREENREARGFGREGTRDGELRHRTSNEKVQGLSWPAQCAGVHGCGRWRGASSNHDLRGTSISLPD